MQDLFEINGTPMALIRIPKCASHSIATAFGLPAGSCHRSVSAMETREPGCLKDRLVVACVREPLDRLVSWHAYHAPLSPDIYFGFGVPGFRSWVHHALPHRFEMLDWTMNPFLQWAWVHGVEAVGADLHILRYEHLDEDWHNLCCRIGKELALPRLNESLRIDFTAYFDDKTRSRAEALLHFDLHRPTP